MSLEDITTVGNWLWTVRMTPIHAEMKKNILVVLGSYSLIEQNIRLNMNGHLASSFPIGAQWSSPELSCQLIDKSMFSNIFYFFSRTSFWDVLFPFCLLSTLSSCLSLGIPLGLFPYISNFTTTLIVDSSSLLMTWRNHRNVLLLITWTVGSIFICLYISSFLCLCFI